MTLRRSRIMACVIVLTTPLVMGSMPLMSFDQRILAAHNAERARAGVSPLMWDNNLGTAAAAYAAGGREALLKLSKTGSGAAKLIGQMK